MNLNYTLLSTRTPSALFGEIFSVANESNAIPPVNVTPIDILPEPLKRVRELAKLRLTRILANLFDSADDALFELADKAVTNIDQTMYFDSMRQVRIQRQGMESVFIQKVQDGFRQLYLADDSELEAQEQAGEASGLALVGDDEMEESVAVRGMISKASNQNAQVLNELTLRFDHLVRAKTVNVLNNPIGPARLCEAFRQASNLLELDIRAKLVVYKLFEKYVLVAVDKVYLEANQLLIEKGVLPQISKAAPKRNPTASTNTNRSSAGAQAYTPSEDSEIFDFLRGLMSDSSTPAGAVSDYLPVVEQGPSLARTDLVDLLSNIQQRGPQTQNLVNFRAEQVDVRQALYNLLQQSHHKNLNQALNKVDNDVINLVSMLFEFILDDHNLSAPMKALLARLQIPLLKVAVLDKSFFSRGGHPARRLLNELATAAMGWSESSDLKRDALYAKVKEVVDRVLNDFVDDVSLFQELLEGFTTFVTSEKRRAQIIEQRTRDAEEGLGRTQYARAFVADLLNQKAAQSDLPEVVVELLREGWSHYLFLLHVREGVESQAWNEAVATIDDLVWSVQPASDKAHSGQLLKMIPSLLQRLRQGLVSISFSKTKMRQLFKDLEALHLRCLRAPPSAPTVNLPSEQSSTVTTELHSEPSNRVVEVQDPLPQAPARIIEPEVALPVEQPNQEPGDEITQRVDALTSGTWFELYKDEKKIRAKLVAVIRATGKYIFVNRVGMKIAEKTRPVLIQELREGQLRVLDDTLLFDRALESVIGHLREMKD